MLALQGITPSGGASYRRVIDRSVICTIGVAAAHVITAVVVVLGLQGDSYETDKVRHVRGRGSPRLYGNAFAKMTLALFPWLTTPTTERSVRRPCNCESDPCSVAGGVEEHQTSRRGILPFVEARSTKSTRKDIRHCILCLRTKVLPAF